YLHPRRTVAPVPCLCLCWCCTRHVHTHSLSLSNTSTHTHALRLRQHWLRHRVRSHHGQKLCTRWPAQPAQPTHSTSPLCALGPGASVPSILPNCPWNHAEKRRHNKAKLHLFAPVLPDSLPALITPLDPRPPSTRPLRLSHGKSVEPHL
ncbi:hypothetical protein COCMIDRAFT_94849, partial [Bipolaris oryzae ATCC 44560]